MLNLVPETPPIRYYARRHVGRCRTCLAHMTCRRPDSLRCKRVGVERVRHERVFDALGRIDLARSVIGGTVGVLRDYTLNDANQRTAVALEDGRRWSFGYDELGQVTSAQKRLSDNTTPLPGYSFGYTFDDIGNRTQTVTNAHATAYTPDSLNRYTSRQVSGTVDVRGEAASDTLVTVNGQTTTRTGKDFYRELPLANTTAAISDTVTITATRTGPPLESVTEERPVFRPQTPETFAHDDDGNLTQDGRWDYTWDAENRLIQAQTRSDIGVQASSLLRQRLTFAYDAQSRRIRKQVETWNTALNSGAGDWETTTDLRFLYDGWNLLTELDARNGNAVIRSYAWGLDLSGSLQGAGGVGGLLWANTTTHTFAASADGNGNIVAYINTATLAVAGRADYGAFGEVVMQTGVAKELPFGFSTKYTDKETGLLYYGYRFYSPTTGRWPSRDPIEEGDGPNMYAMLGNNPVSSFDALGLWAQGAWTKKPWTPHPRLSGSVSDLLSANANHFLALQERFGMLPVSRLAFDLLSHYLFNSGTEYSVDLSKIVSEETTLKNMLRLEIMRGMQFAEGMATSGRIHSNEYYSGIYGTRNYWALGSGSEYQGDARITTSTSGCITMQVRFHIWDPWDFIYGDHWKKHFAGVGLTDGDMRRMHDYGFASEFLVSGTTKIITFQWAKGSTRPDPITQIDKL